MLTVQRQLKTGKTSSLMGREFLNEQQESEDPFCLALPVQVSGL